MRDFIVVREKGCPFCVVIKTINALTGRKIDILYYGSGSPREELLKKFLYKIKGKKPSIEDMPTGVVNGVLINSCRDWAFTYHLFKGLK